MADHYRTRLPLSGADWHLPAGSVSTGTEQAGGFTWVVFPAEPMPVWFEAEAVQVDNVTFEQVEMEEVKQWTA